MQNAIYPEPLPMTRRGFLTNAAAVSSLPPSRGRSARPPRILLRSSWQSVNIGDVGHTPGALSLLGSISRRARSRCGRATRHGSRELLTRNYPRLKIVEGASTRQGSRHRPSWQRRGKNGRFACRSERFGIGIPASADAIRFHRATGKPVGVFGVSTDPISGIGAEREPEAGTLEEIRKRAAKLPPTHLGNDLRYIIDRAEFFFCRDTISRDYLKSQRVKTPILEFALTRTGHDAA